MRKILITGSHFTVAQAVVEQLLKVKDVEIAYVGRSKTMEGDSVQSVESKILPKLGVQFYTLTAGRVKREASFGAIISLVKIPVGMWQAWVLVGKIKPDVVLSFGGYISVPIVVAAKLRGVPVMLHEQTLISGLSNRVGAMFADKIAVSFADGRYDFDPKKMVLTGNPIREELLGGLDIQGRVGDFFKTAARKSQKVIYVTGGNQGAQAINQVIAEGLSELTKKAMIIWQTGDSKNGNFEKALATVQKLGLEDKVLVSRWFEAFEVGIIYRQADLIICRGGINTLNEVKFFNQRAIVIPYPYLYKDEQLVNARYFEKLGIVDVIVQKNFNFRRLIEIVNLRLGDSSKVPKNIAKDESALRVSKELLGLLKS